MIVLIYGILLAAYWVCPTHIKLIGCIINFLVPDPVPFLDEAIMVLGLLRSRD